jgi:hypothetical protein
MAQSIYSNQDACSNVAVQPASNTGSVKLKKNAVKIVVSLASTTPFQAAPAAGQAGKASRMYLPHLQSERRKRQQSQQA